MAGNISFVRIVEGFELCQLSERIQLIHSLYEILSETNYLLLLRYLSLSFWASPTIERKRFVFTILFFTIKKGTQNTPRVSVWLFKMAKSHTTRPKWDQEKRRQTHFRPFTTETIKHGSSRESQMSMTVGGAALERKSSVWIGELVFDSWRNSYGTKVFGVNWRSCFWQLVEKRWSESFLCELENLSLAVGGAALERKFSAWIGEPVIDSWWSSAGAKVFGVNWRICHWQLVEQRWSESLRWELENLSLTVGGAALEPKSWLCGNWRTCQGKEEAQKDEGQKLNEKQKNSKTFEEEKSNQVDVQVQWGKRRKSKLTQDESWIGWSWFSGWGGFVKKVLRFDSFVFVLFIWRRVGRPTLMRCLHHHHHHHQAERKEVGFLLKFQEQEALHEEQGIWQQITEMESHSRTLVKEQRNQVVSQAKFLIFLQETKAEREVRLLNYLNSSRFLQNYEVAKEYFSHHYNPGISRIKKTFGALELNCIKLFVRTPSRYMEGIILRLSCRTATSQCTRSLFRYRNLMNWGILWRLLEISKSTRLPADPGHYTPPANQ